MVNELNLVKFLFSQKLSYLSNIKIILWRHHSINAMRQLGQLITQFSILGQYSSSHKFVSIFCNLTSILYVSEQWATVNVRVVLLLSVHHSLASNTEVRISKLILLLLGSLLIRLQRPVDRDVTDNNVLVALILSRSLLQTTVSDFVCHLNQTV